METPDAMDRISGLPEPVLQRILYFLIDDKEAARTCILSKSWRSICSNRPKLSLSERTFEGNNKDFLFHANNTLQSLLDQNHQGIAEFHLTISTVDSQSLAFLQKWIPMLTSMSIKHLYLDILLPSNNQQDAIDLPFEAFAAESLQKLHLRKCNLFQDHNNIPFKHHLTTLRLRHVSVKEEQSIVDQIISSCPLLTSMRFERCKGLRNIKLNHKNLRHFTFIRHKSYTRKRDCSIEIGLPTLETIKIYGSEVRFDNREYSKLKSLFLQEVRISNDSFGNSSSCSFPSLEDLSLMYYCYNRGGLLCIDAPNMVKFKYLDTQTPSISFAATSGKWSSEITMRLFRLQDAQSWFLKLSEFLHSLSQSDITLKILSLHIPENPLALENIDIGGNKKPAVVESLKLGGNVPCFAALLDCLFCICHPRYIDQYWYFSEQNETMRMEQKELADLLGMILIKRKQREEIRKHHHLPNDVNIESFDSDGGEWQFAEYKSLTQFASTNSETFRKIRFYLKWSQDC